MLFSFFSTAEKDISTMTSDCIVHRYSAYYSGWCVAFGEHDIHYEPDKEINWLYGESKIGLILAPGLKKRLFRQLLRSSDQPPSVELSDNVLKINEFTYPIEDEEDKRGFSSIKRLFQQSPQLHLYLTSHFCYPKGTRIVTFSPHKPIGIIYKEIQSMRVALE
ncbi:MAG TPA: hypothetical protein EYH03_06240 [Chromatiales bacterium]|nr:hypothetical protein [Chromatiales bacterium]